MLFDAESETKKQEIFDLLLVAGYFRIRIPSLSDFDKILGGLSWGILVSGFDIDIDLEYSDEFKLKQKIKLSERVIKALKKMKCIHPLLPHQIQGLDYGAIYPVVQWLLKFVDQTRLQRQDVNQRISSEIGERLIGSKLIFVEVPSAQIAKLQTRNKKVRKFEFNDPIRVYSALAEMGNKKAASMYQKLSLERAGGGEGVKKGGQEEGAQDQNDFEEAKTTGDFASDLKAQLAAQKENKLLKKNQSQRKTHKKKNIEEEDSEDEIEEVDIENIQDFEEKRALRRSNSINADGFMRLIEMNREDNEDLVDQIKDIETKEEEGSGAGALLQKEKLIFHEQKEQITDTIEKSENKLGQYKEMYQEVKEEEQEVIEEVNQLTEQNEEYTASLNTTESKIEKRKKQLEDVEMKEIEEIITRITQIKEEKIRIKSKAKSENKKLQGEKEKYEKNLEKLEAHKGVEEINEEYEERKLIYSKKQEELAQVSKEVSLLSRKIQEYPSTIEVGQYYKRYVDLFERVAEETENQRKLDMIFNRKCDIQRLIDDHKNLLKSIKQGVLDCKKKKHRVALNDSLKDAIVQTKMNLVRSKKAFEKAEKESEYLRDELDRNLGYQREYYQLLKKIQYEYERLQG